MASLKWVQENIENFGGDPTRVFIFGQSGGGAKTSAIYSMPAAKGLFSRAAVQSGSALRGQTRETAAKAAQALMKELGVTKAERLVDVPWTKLAGRTTDGAGARIGVLAGRRRRARRSAVIHSIRMRRRARRMCR